MGSEVLFNVVLPIMLFVVAGYLFKRMGKFDSAKSDTLINYAMLVAIPSMIIVALANEPVEDYLPYATFFGTFLLITTIVFLVAVAAAMMFRMPFLEGSFFAATCSLSNTCMIALPILAMLMGRTGTIYGILGVINLIIGLQVMSLIYDLYHGAEGESRIAGFFKSLAREFHQPYFIALVIGVVLSAFNWKLPDTLDTTLSLLGATTAPVALFAVGIDLDFGVFKKNLLAIFGATVFKLVLMPILAWFMCQWLGLNPAATVAVILCSSVAAAKCEFGIAKQKHIYVEQTAAIVASTTILSFGTLAVVVYLLTAAHPQVFDMNRHFHFNPHHDHAEAQHSGGDAQSGTSGDAKRSDD
jgi:malonate transporter